ncbi:hypothetical protein SCLCIDRAFT_24700 [Scleroderma citrinum Foug A]|uniref:NAD(P)-binding protein n=1 Tax=Scleroderma citrinum Foug A TaxID=1036808 RepID=A0A0C3E4B8_9AGAM|nr:hypothetical protein SCLCIDRAFT_24700 [Scleroderma citrinum Foug A]
MQYRTVIPAPSKKPLFVIVGVSNEPGDVSRSYSYVLVVGMLTQSSPLTGVSTARLFARKGYRIALISLGKEALNKLTKELQSDGEAAAFPVADYTPNSIRSAFTSIRSRFPPATSPLRVALFNVGNGVQKHFLDITDNDVRYSFDVNVAAFAFSHEVITAFSKLGFEDLSEGGKGGSRKKGTLLFTGTTASIHGSTTTSAFAAEKHALRALAQSLAKEFGEKNIHIAHSIIDGDFLTERNGGNDTRLDSASIAKSYLNLVQQDSTAWTWEIDLRPAHKKW